MNVLLCSLSSKLFICMFNKRYGFDVCRSSPIMFSAAAVASVCAVLVPSNGTPIDSDSCPSMELAADDNMLESIHLRTSEIDVRHHNEM